MSILDKLFVKKRDTTLRDLSGQKEASGLYEKGVSLYKQGKFKQSVDYFEQALTIYKKTFGEQHPDVATTLNYIGSAWDNLEEFRKALRYYEQALVIYKEVYGDEHSFVATTLNNMGLSCLSIDPYRAKGYLETALLIMYKELGKNHSQTKQTEIHLATVNANLRR